MRSTNRRHVRSWFSCNCIPFCDFSLEQLFLNLFCVDNLVRGCINFVKYRLLRSLFNKKAQILEWLAAAVWNATSEGCLERLLLIVKRKRWLVCVINPNWRSTARESLNRLANAPNRFVALWRSVITGNSACKVVLHFEILRKEPGVLLGHFN